MRAAAYLHHMLAEQGVACAIGTAMYLSLHVSAAELVRLALLRVIDAAESSSEGDPLPDSIATCNRAAKFVSALLNTGDAVALTQWSEVLQGAIHMMEEGRASVALFVSPEWIRWIDADIQRARASVAEFLDSDTRAIGV